MERSMMRREAISWPCDHLAPYQTPRTFDLVKEQLRAHAGRVRRFARVAD